MTTNQPQISSLTIAELAGVSHAEVLRDIRKALARSDIDSEKFLGRCLGNDGERHTCFYLARRECDLVVSNYGLAIIWPTSADSFLN